MSWKSWRGVTLPGFSALASSTHANWAAPATLSGLRTVASAVRAGPALPSPATKARVAAFSRHAVNELERTGHGDLFGRRVAGRRRQRGRARRSPDRAQERAGR